MKMNALRQAIERIAEGMLLRDEAEAERKVRLPKAWQVCTARTRT